MKKDWTQFFAFQRRLLKEVLVEPSAEEVFEKCAYLIAKEVSIESISWDSSKDGVNWQPQYAWPKSIGETDNELSGRSVVSTSLEDGGDQHRFCLNAPKSADHISDAHLEALVSTLKVAVDLKIEILKKPQDANGSERKLGHALIDEKGDIISADEYFISLINGVIRDWDSKHLPFEIPITPQVLKNGVSWRRLYFFVAQKGEHILLRGRPDRRLPKLTSREIEVVELIMDGNTFKQVGSALDIAPSTASTHLYKVYEKLNINRKTELVEWIKGHPDLLIPD